MQNKLDSASIWLLALIFLHNKKKEHLSDAEVFLLKQKNSELPPIQDKWKKIYFSLRDRELVNEDFRITPKGIEVVNTSVYGLNFQKIAGKANVGTTLSALATFGKVLTDKKNKGFQLNADSSTFNDLAELYNTLVDLLSPHFNLEEGGMAEQEDLM